VTSTEKQKMHEDQADRTDMIGKGKISGLLWHFSAPAIVAMLANASYNIINRVFVGRAVGGIAIAAIAVSFPIMMFFMSISFLIGVGATTLISIRLGQKKKDEAEIIMGHALTWLIVLPLILCTGLYLYIEPMLILFGTTENLLPYATDYLKIMLPGMIIMSVSLGMNNIIRAEGSPRIAMMTQISGGAVNVGFNYLYRQSVHAAAHAHIRLGPGSATDHRI
jgi:Na+-driven multidrug efflux pump